MRASSAAVAAALKFSSAVRRLAARNGYLVALTTEALITVSQPPAAVARLGRLVLPDDAVPTGLSVVGDRAWVSLRGAAAVELRRYLCPFRVTAQGGGKTGMTGVEKRAQRARVAVVAV